MKPFVSPTDLVKTEAETVPPPDVTVPEPSSGSVEPAMIEEVKRLADRVGGLAKLRELVDRLGRLDKR